MRRLPLLPSALVAATLIVLLGFLGIVRQNVAQMRSLRDETGRVEHTLQVQRALDAVLLQASEADNAARGFLLVGGDTAFNEYRQARDQLKEQLAQFQELTRDRADQQTIAALQGALAARLSALDRVIAIRRVSGVDEAMAAARAADTVRWRIESRAVASALEREEAKLLDSRRAQADIAYRRAVNGRIGSGVVSALLLVGVVALAMAHARSREKRESALIASEKRALEAATREQDARSEAERANQLKDEFLAVLSHELRTPLNAVLGWAQILQAAGPQEPTLVRALASIKRNAEAQQHLVEDLLDVSRIVTGKFPMKRETVEFRSAVAAAAEAIGPAAAAKGVKLSVTLDGAAVVNGDADRLQQVASNILSNALKFTPGDGQIEVELATDATTARLTIRDSGDGIPPALLPHIFDRFRQGDGSSTRVHGGLGLGLAIAKHIVDAHGGAIEAHSEGTGKGATFVVRLPINGEHGTHIHGATPAS